MIVFDSLIIQKRSINQSVQDPIRKQLHRSILHHCIVTSPSIEHESSQSIAS